MKELIEYCLTKKGAYLDYPFGNIPICVKVAGKIFAELYPVEQDYKITLKCEPMLADYYRNRFPKVVVRGYHCPPVQQPYRNTIYINHIDKQLLLEMIDHSYEQVIHKLPIKEQKKLIQCITKQELEAKGALLIDYIDDGFEKYQYKMLEGSNEELFDEIRELRNKNGVEYSYGDFYYGTLLEEEKERIRDILSTENRCRLVNYEKIKEVLYLPLTDDVLSLTMELNAKEALFTTYYFCNSSCTVWGNYNNVYPMFYSDNRRVTM